MSLTVTNAAGGNTVVKTDWILVIDLRVPTPLDWILRWFRAHLSM